MRRGPAGLLLFVAAILLALAGGCWLLQRVAFDSGFSGRATVEVFDDVALREQVATAVGAATAERLGQPAADLAGGILANFQLMLHDVQVHEILRDVVEQVHRRLVDDGADPPAIDGQQMVLIVRNQNVFDLPAAALAVDQISWLSTAGTIVQWVMVLSTIGAVITIVLGVMAHPSRSDVVFAVGVFCIAGAASALLLGFVLPAYAIPALSDDPWSSLFGAVARTELPVVGAVSAVLVVVGCVLIFGSVGLGRRKTKNWSAPVRPARYSSEQRQWSR